MKIIFLFLSLLVFASFKNPDPGLPFEQDLTFVDLGKIPLTQQIRVNFLMSLPTDHHLNPGAPSSFGVYEKWGKGDWQLQQKFSLNDYPIEGSELHFFAPVTLVHDDSEVALFATVYHCRVDNTRCQIQGFKSKSLRSKQKAKSAILNFNIQAVNK